MNILSELSRLADLAVPTGLSAVVGSFLVAELLLSGVLWAAYSLLRRALPTAADRFLFLRLSFLALLVLPWLPALLPQPLAVPLTVTIRLPAHVRAAASGPASLLSPVWAQVASGLALLYLGWMVRCAVSVGRSAYRLHRLVRGAEAVVLPGGETVFLHDGELPPATVGFLRPRILISRPVYARLAQRAVQLILRHEAVHIRRRDAVWNALVVLLRELLALSPFVRALARHFENEMELSVDEAVLADRTIRPREYGQLLLDLSTLVLPAAAPSCSGLYIARSLVARRISAMSRPATGKNRPALAIAAFAAFSLLGGVGVSALPSPPLAFADAGGKSVANTSESALQIFLVEDGGNRSVTDEDGKDVPLAATPILTTADLSRATFNEGENPTVSVQLRPAAAARFAAFSGSHIGRKLAILLEGKLLAAPVIKSRIEGDSILLSGHFPTEMRRLAATINAGASR